MRRDGIRSVCVMVEIRARHLFSPRLSASERFAVFESKVLRHADVRAGRFDCATRRSLELNGDSSVLVRLEPTHALRTEILGIRVSHGPNQSSEPTTTAVTIPAAQEVVPAAVVAHL